LLSLPAFAAGGTVDLRWVSPPPEQIQSGKIISGSFLIINFSETDRTFFGKWILPPGWRSLTPEELELGLGPGETMPVTFALLVPQDQPAGNYRILFQAESMDEEQLRDQLLTTVSVEPQAALATALLAAPRIAVPGEPFDVSVNITNRGNCTTTVVLNLPAVRNVSIQTEDRTFLLKPGERRAVKLKVTTSPNVDYRGNIYLALGFEADDCKGGKLLARQSVRVEMLPPPGVGDSPYILLPGRARFVTLYDNHAFDYQLEIEGEGWLDEGRTRRLGYFIRTPDADRNQRLGVQESFFLNYDGPQYSFLLGDSSYGLSRLTESGHYGRGLRISRDEAKDQLGVYYIDDIDPEPNSAQRFGSYWRRQVTPSLRTGLNYLNRQAGDYEDDLLSLGLHWKTPQTFDLDGELGFSSTTREDAGSSSDYALLLGATWWDGRTPWADVDFLYAGPDYMGGEHDRQVISSSFILKPDALSTLRINLKRAEDNLKERESSSSAGTEHLVGAELGRDLKREFDFDATLGVVGEYREKHDRMTPRGFDEESLAAGLRWTQRQGILNLNALGMMGKAEDDIDGETKWIERYSVNAILRFSNRLRTSFFWSKGPSGFRITARDEENMGVSASWVPMDNLELRGAYKISNQMEEDEVRRQAQASLRWDTWYGHNVIFEGWHEWWDREAEEKATYARLMYTVPYDLPIGTRLEVGSVRGRVHENGAGIPGALVRLDGSAALADAQGRYTFAAKRIGTYTFRIDPATLKPGMIINLPQPVTLSISPGSATEFDLPVTLEAKLNGKLSLPPGSPAVEGEGKYLFYGMAELRRDDEVFRVPITTSGNFNFSGLRPGDWELRFPDLRLPTRHRLETTVMKITLAPGENRTLEPRIVFQEFKVRVIDSGVIKSSSEPSSQGAGEVPGKPVEILPPLEQQQPPATGGRP
jgi:hypothetical protein